MAEENAEADVRMRVEQITQRARWLADSCRKLERYARLMGDRAAPPEQGLPLIRAQLTNMQTLVKSIEEVA